MRKLIEKIKMLQCGEAHTGPEKSFVSLSQAVVFE